jgi:hypothetical protein
LERLTYPLDMSRRFETRWLARLEAERKCAGGPSARPTMKTRERIERVRQALDTHRTKRGVRESLALARRKEAEGVEQRQHAGKKKPPAGGAPPSSGTKSA